MPELKSADVCLNHCMSVTFQRAEKQVEQLAVGRSGDEERESSETNQSRAYMATSSKSAWPAQQEPDSNKIK